MVQIHSVLTRIEALKSDSDFLMTALVITSPTRRCKVCTWDSIQHIAFLFDVWPLQHERSNRAYHKFTSDSTKSASLIASHPSVVLSLHHWEYSASSYTLPRRCDIDKTWCHFSLILANLDLSRDARQRNSLIPLPCAYPDIQMMWS
jgi:hypothetical protein